MQLTTPKVTIRDTGMDTGLFAERLKSAAQEHMGEEWNEKAFFRLCQQEDEENAPSYSTVRNALAGERVPKMDNAIVMARAIGISLDWLAGFTDERYSHKKSGSDVEPQRGEVPEMGPSGSLQAARNLGLVPEGDIPRPAATFPGWELVGDDGTRLRIDLCVEGEPERAQIKASWQSTEGADVR